MGKSDNEIREHLDADPENLKRKRDEVDDTHKAAKKEKPDVQQSSGSTQFVLQEFIEIREKPPTPNIFPLDPSLIDLQKPDDVMTESNDLPQTPTEHTNDHSSASSSPSHVSQETQTLATQFIEILMRTGAICEDKKVASIDAIAQSGLIKTPLKQRSLSFLSPVNTPPGETISPYNSSQSPAMQYEDDHQMPERGRTMIGQQGEHVSAYTLYEELVLSILENTNTKHAADALQNGLSCLLLSEKAQFELQQIYQQGAEKIDQNISKEDRAHIIGTLSECYTLTRDKTLIDRFVQTVHTPETEQGMQDAKIVKKVLINIQKNQSDRSKIVKTRDAIRTANRVNLSKLVKEIVNSFLKGANKMHYVSFPLEGMPSNPHTGQEKTAKNSLRVLSEFLCDINESAQELTNNPFSKVTAKHKQELFNNFGIRVDDLHIDLKKPSEKLSKSEYARNITSSFIDEVVMNKIAEKINALFWHPRITNLLDPVSEQWSQIFQKKRYNKGTIPRNNDVDILYHVTARHIVLIFNCFKGLQKLSADMQRNIVDVFLKYVIEFQGWKDEEINLNQFKDAIMLKARINYETSYFSMREIAEKDPHVNLGKKFSPG
jgi:hypothetical protein